MRTLNRLITAVTHRDLDLYVLLGTSVILVGVEIWAHSWTTALFAGTLLTFALSMFRLRHDVGAIKEQRTGLASIFLDRTPADVTLSMKTAGYLLLIGVSLDRTLRNAYAALEAFLRKGGRLRVLVVDPRAEWSVRIADRRAYLEHGIDQRRAHIEAAIRTFGELRQRTGGTVEIKTTEDPLTFGAAMIDGTGEPTSETRIVIQHYSYKKHNATEPNPVFIVRPSDGQWYAEFREELENLWRDSTLWGGQEGGVPLT